MTFLSASKYLLYMCAGACFVALHSYMLLLPHLLSAFGNYRDILQEISFSPLMAENLSFLQSKSAAYTWEHQNKISFADENFVSDHDCPPVLSFRHHVVFCTLNCFHRTPLHDEKAREIMQLFSTGLDKLNLDGTPVLDDKGKPVLAYTNDEIMSFARVWTGFDYQQGRGNVEETSWSGNRHDPMTIQASWRDKFPKTDMNGGYIGDGYPLCVDLPDQMFLKTGGSYRLLGASHMPELMEDDPYFKNDLYLKKFVLNSNSTLKAALCDVDINGNCQYKNTVTLDSNLPCTDTECNADTVRVVQVNNVHYEFVRPACVEQVFYADAKKVINKYRNADSSCANPLLSYASEACCEGTFDQTAERYENYLYDQERVKFSTANARCQLMGMMSCDFNTIEGIDHQKKGYHWTTDSCQIKVKVNDEGQVALVYEPEVSYIETLFYILLPSTSANIVPILAHHFFLYSQSYEFLHPHVRDDNRNFFKVSGLTVHVCLVLYLVQLMYTAKTHDDLFSNSRCIGMEKVTSTPRTAQLELMVMAVATAPVLAFRLVVVSVIPPFLNPRSSMLCQQVPMKSLKNSQLVHMILLPMNQMPMQKLSPRMASRPIW